MQVLQTLGSDAMFWVWRSVVLEGVLRSIRAGEQNRFFSLFDANHRKATDGCGRPRMAHGG